MNLLPSPESIPLDVLKKLITDRELIEAICLGWDANIVFHETQAYLTTLGASEDVKKVLQNISEQDIEMIYSRAEAVKGQVEMKIDTLLNPAYNDFIKFVMALYIGNILPRVFTDAEKIQEFFERFKSDTLLTSPYYKMDILGGENIHSGSNTLN